MFKTPWKVSYQVGIDMLKLITITQPRKFYIIVKVSTSDMGLSSEMTSVSDVGNNLSHIKSNKTLSGCVIVQPVKHSKRFQFSFYLKILMSNGTMSTGSGFQNTNT